MCTATWLRTGAGYDLLFNRDERKTRAEAEPPRAEATEHVRWIGPRDPEGGGTWIGTSESGLTVAVLNGHRSLDEDARDWTSRGGLVPALVPAADLPQLETRLRRLDLESVRSFRLLALSPAAPALVAEWDRRSLVVDRDAEARVPLVSSSFDEHEVGEARRAEFARRTRGRIPDLRTLLAFHKSTERGPSAFSVSMERAEAATRSLTHVTVGAEEIRMFYHGGRPDLAAPESTARLARAARSKTSLPSGRT
jgi:hypothetical protein